jgi:hypothetical protein
VLRQKLSLSFHNVGTELNLNAFPNNTIHASGFSGEVGGIVK